ncbi:MurR/RpiR family transcriptional regulator [Dactylosporangium matsuzakiense]|uniref:RpiR family transcriptional regulator n=1 Tax=Dactylosporangium matsuzakiense TaxID=53360 RepID=A0A9W6KKG5_9ACTN|nr:MurR/RpiR family transcriptional regulator [Dactylosporangium matsuzakiense]UWZ43263.1 MurR/RpiR family transcriptional regulator [Dactylosporangium matsuzakiense]GLL02632.1 RpiR family transcriptional regulator [Dactylosporangium matsuzakiense]
MDLEARLSGVYAELTPGERAVARVILDDFPYAALGSLRALAQRSGVSPPTVSRLVTRLGFATYAELQQAIQHNDRSRLRSFVADPADLAQAALTLRKGLDGCLAAVPESLLETVAEQLTRARAVWALGGRLSELAAEYLVRQLASLRPGVRHVPATAAERARVLLDIGAGDLLVAYDFRRYNTHNALFVNAAVTRGARLVLVTDAWESPLARRADVLVRLPREAAGPIDPITLEVAVTELVLVTVAARLAPAERLAELENVTRELSGLE